MTRILSILLLSSLLLQSFSRVILVANYHLNKEFITEAFCENKSKPELACNGKCHLKKQLKEEDNKEDSPLNNLKEKFEVQLFCQALDHISINSTLSGKSPFTRFLLQKTISPKFPIFHPPTC